MEVDKFLQQPSHLRYQFEALDADFGKLDESLGWTLSEFEADPKALSNASAVERLAVSLGRLGLMDEAEHVMTAAMRLGPDNPSVFAGRSMLYIMQGRMRELDEHQLRYIAATGVDLMDLPRWMAFALGAGHAIRGESTKAIELLEPVMENKPDPRLIDSQNDLALEFRQLPAYAYQGVGRSADAEDQVSAIDQALQSTHDQGFARSPRTLARWAVNDAMRGRMAEGLVRLQQAYDVGWREDYASTSSDFEKNLRGNVRANRVRVRGRDTKRILHTHNLFYPGKWARTRRMRSRTSVLSSAIPYAPGDSVNSDRLSDFCPANLLTEPTSGRAPEIGS